MFSEWKEMTEEKKKNSKKRRKTGKVEMKGNKLHLVFKYYQSERKRKKEQ